jgi:membrane-bound metal-dependent hydrolase YbcI (DUF457 family)
LLFRDLAAARREGAARFARWWAVFALCMATHPVLDAMSTYSLGIEFFAPFSQHRYRFPWQPLTDPGANLGVALRNEIAWALLPLGALASLGSRRRRRRSMSMHVHPWSDASIPPPGERSS